MRASAYKPFDCDRVRCDHRKLTQLASWTKATHSANVGPLHLEVQEKEHVNIPLWAGIAAIGGGVLLLAFGRRA